MAWTIFPTLRKSGNYLFLNLHCVSDGNALAATDFLSETYMPRDLKPKIQGHTVMEVKCDPGASAQPDQAWDVTLYDRDGDSILAITDTSATVPARYDASTDIGTFPTIEDKMFIGFPTAGDWTATDSVDIRLKMWRESGAR